ncbi:peptidase family M48-domain-containing protein [Ganoderma leucocontextum]|nr:peptidase family M48-domain-containing protein [Ganoderma leucocontextum]
MLRSVLNRSPSPGINPFRSPTASGLHSHPRRNLLWLVPKAEYTAVALSPTFSEPGPSTLPSASSLGSLHSFRSHVLVSGGSSISTRRNATRPVYLSPSNVRAFHSTPRNQISPLPFLGLLLKSSTALEFARMTARVGLTFVPLILLRNMRSKKWLQRAEESGHPKLEQKREDILRGMRQRTILFHILVFIPLVLYWATIIASLERTPLTGRWRVILLSPEEEEEIAAQLAGPGWYRAVGEILSADGGSPSIIPPSDWRLLWVRDTLRRLESAIPTLQEEEEVCPDWMDCGPDDIPLPPPAEYPLRPRPRGSETLRRWAELSCARVAPPAPHAIAGPPYSLLLVDRPDASNAFSYGFGPDGGGGIVVFSGFVDEVLARHPCPPAEPPAQSFLSQLFGLGPRAPRYPVPTEEQTAELATLLAHELAHLVLSHHIETLSSGSIVWPSVLSIVTDAIRAFIFPVTMLFGPFINDALAGMWKAGAGEFSQLQEFCTSQKQEVEADVVSIRLLAHAGFDPREAVRFWESRSHNAQTAECSPTRAEAAVVEEPSTAARMARRIMGETHPVHELRVDKLKSELERWEQMRRAAREARDREREQQRVQAEKRQRP